MKKTMHSIKKSILNIVFWSVISAAFIGPGTVTTATKAGSDFQFQLLWSLVFATFACLVLQEASARVTIYSGKNLGQAIKYYFRGKKTQASVLFLITGAIIAGCAAYETGNILGSVEGISLIFPKFDKRILVLIFAVMAGVALSLKSLRKMATFIGSFVFVMGATFITTAVFSHLPVPEIIKGSLMPSLPDTPGAGLLVLGLIGTTVVPYDLFLGSSVIQKDTTIRDMRIGISTAIILGGIISMAILVVGTEMTRGLDPEAVKNLPFSFKLLEQTLVIHIGTWAVYIFGFGLFAAGFSSAITSPLASALTARSIFEKEKQEDQNGFVIKGKEPWYKSYTMLAYAVLIVGVAFGLMNIKPVPAIIMAQAFNGLILPFISIFLIWVINDVSIMGKQHLNGWFSNICMAIVVWVTLVLGIVNVVKAIFSIFGSQINSPDTLFAISAVVSLVITVLICVKIIIKRTSNIVVEGE